MGVYSEWASYFYEDLIKWISKHGIQNLMVKDCVWSVKIEDELSESIIVVKPVATYAEQEFYIHDLGLRVLLFQKDGKKTNHGWIFKRQDFGNDVDEAIFQKIANIFRPIPQLPKKDMNRTVKSLKDIAFITLSTNEIAYTQKTFKT